MPPDLKHDVSILSDSAEIAAEAYAPEGFPGGVEMQVLRRLDNGSIRSAVLTIPPGWSSGGAHIGAVAEQGFLLHGSLMMGDIKLEAEDYYFHPAGSPIGQVLSEHGAKLIVIHDGPQSFRPAIPDDKVSADAIPRLSVSDVEPVNSVVDGQTLTVRRRILWRDAKSGADTRHLTIPVGTEGLGAEWHPVNEEIFFLTDDAPTGQDGVGPGWFLFNPAYGVHGGARQTTKSTRTLLEWHDGPWELIRV
jgi:hypothetical protein